MKSTHVLAAAAMSLVVATLASLPALSLAAEAETSVITLPLPGAPTSKAPVSTVTTRSLTCVALKHGDSTRYGTVDVAYENRATRDTDGDGVADAAPKWVLSSMNAYYYSDEEAVACR